MIMCFGFRPCCFRPSNTATTRSPGSEVSTSISSDSRVQPSIRFRVRNRRPLANVSCVKSIVQTWSGSVGGVNTSRAAAGPGGGLAYDKCPTSPPHTAGIPACGLLPTLRAPTALATCGSRTGAVLRPARAAALAAGRPPAVADTDTSPDESGSARRRVALKPLLPSASLPPPASAAAGSPFFCDHRLQRPFVQQQFGHGVLELVVLLLQLPQPFRLTHLHPAVLPLPAVEAPPRDAMPPAQLSRLHSRLRFLQDGDDLFLAESTLPHDSSSGPGGPS